MVIRRVLRLGTYLLPEICKRTPLGRAALEYFQKRRRRNKARRDHNP